jgi:hypothetical protein
MGANNTESEQQSLTWLQTMSNFQLGYSVLHQGYEAVEHAVVHIDSVGTNAYLASGPKFVRHERWREYHNQ